MTLGDKIKKARKEQGITQSVLAGDKITRNMLSAIESGKAFPSVETAKYLANRLSLPLAYLMSEDDNIFAYKKNSAIHNIRSLYEAKKYKYCIDEINKLGETDEELSYILAECYYNIGKELILNGSIASGEKYINEALKYSKMTVYNTSHIKAGLIIYQAISLNVQAPLPEINTNEYDSLCNEIVDIELYKYITQDTSYKFKNEIFASHTKARELINNRRFGEALKLLCEIEAMKNKENYNSYSVFALYTDLERCYREIGDYKNAYRYANKRLSLLEAFKK